VVDLMPPTPEVAAPFPAATSGYLLPTLRVDLRARGGWWRWRWPQDRQQQRLRWGPL
jgi:hypothetical protein